MYSKGQRGKAVEAFARFDHGHADAVAGLGCPTTSALRGWWREHQLRGDEFLERSCREPRYPDGKRRAAVDCYLGHGKGLTRTIGAMGHPSREMLGAWIDGLAPGQRRYRGPNPKRGALPMETRARAVAELEARAGGAAEVAERHGVSRVAPYAWRREILGHNEGDPGGRGVPVSRPYDDLPDGIRESERMRSDLRAQVRKLRLEMDVRQATLEIPKKGPGTDPSRLANAERAATASPLRPRWGLKDLPAPMQMAKGSHEYAAAALVRPGSAERAESRAAVVKAFDDSGGTHGHRRIVAQTGAGERAVRTIMDEGGLVARAAKKRRRHGSYQGEASEAPDDLPRDGRGRRHLRAGRPNALWATDVTELRIPAGKPHLPPTTDCLDGMPMGWAMSASPDAGMANSSLMGACARLREGEHPKGHSDRGCHHRWPERIKICDGHGIVRSMPGEGRGPDNARAEGFFGRPKTEFLYGGDWGGVTPDGFADVLDAYLRWHRDVRLKGDLGYRGPMQYRRDLGLIA